MPYRLSGNCVQVERSSGWEDLKCHETKAEAEAHLGALMANVGDEHVELHASISKLDEDRHLVFGWAYVAELDGADVVDHSGDVVGKAALEDLELAFYDYVLKSREADEMHQTFTGIGKLVECVVLTPEKAEAMGITTKRYGAWVGFKVTDEAVWVKIKDGTYSMLSIRGTGTKEELSDA